MVDHDPRGTRQWSPGRRIILREAGAKNPRGWLLPAFPGGRCARLRYPTKLGARRGDVVSTGGCFGPHRRRLTSFLRLDAPHLTQQDRPGPGGIGEIPCPGNASDARALVSVHTNLKIRVPRHQATPLVVVVSQNTTRSYGGRSRCAVLRCNTTCDAGMLLRNAGWDATISSSRPIHPSSTSLTLAANAAAAKGFSMNALPARAMLRRATSSLV